ncbi:MAG: PilZ domain-containing protein [Clostridia bacterium]|nr:PilZ domain-containing protein [Clostridia bacterium]
MNDQNFIIHKEEREDVFKRGAVLSIKHPLIFEPILTVIQSVEDMSIFFKVPDEFLKSNVLKGDMVSCHIFQGDYEFVATGIISEIDIGYPHMVRISLDKVEKYKNNRKAKRYPVNFQANITTPGGSKKVYAIIKNINNIGVSAVFKEQIDLNSHVKVDVSAQIGKREMLEFKARVVRTIPMGSYNEYGLEIVDIDELNRDLMEKVIFHLQENESLYVTETLK